MAESLRIAVADDEPVMQLYLEDTLTWLGHEVVAVAADGAELVRACRDKRPDLVITDIKMPVMDGLDAAQELCREAPLPILFITGYADKRASTQEQCECVLTYLVKPVNETDLQRGIREVMERYAEFQAILEEESSIKKALADRRTVEAAKAYLRSRNGLTDKEAFEHLREEARRRGVPLLQVAEDFARY